MGNNQILATHVTNSVSNLWWESTDHSDDNLTGVSFIFGDGTNKWLYLKKGVTDLFDPSTDSVTLFGGGGIGHGVGVGLSS